MRRDHGTDRAVTSAGAANLARRPRTIVCRATASAPRTTVAPPGGSAAGRAAGQRSRQHGEQGHQVTVAGRGQEASTARRCRVSSTPPAQ